MSGTAASIARALGGHRSGSGYLCRCPVPNHGRGRGDRTPSLSIADGDERLLVNCFGGCDALDVLDELRRRGLLVEADDHSRAPRRAPTPRRSRPSESGETHARRQLEKAVALWRRRRPVIGSPVKPYLRDIRRYGGPVPPTIGSLPTSKPGHLPGMIAVFGFCEEPEPGNLAVIVDAIRGVHLTLLRSDGLGKADVQPNKIMVGSSSGCPIVLAPPNDLLGLVICEGIETGLSLFEATGLGVWAAGSASRMPALAAEVPAWIDCVTIAAEDDAAGRKHSAELLRRLGRRGIFAETRLLGVDARLAA